MISNDQSEAEARAVIQEAREQGVPVDICYRCGRIQAYGTMHEVDQVGFEVYCDDCLKKLISLANILGKRDGSDAGNEQFREMMEEFKDQFGDYTTQDGYKALSLLNHHGTKRYRYSEDSPFRPIREIDPDTRAGLLEET